MAINNIANALRSTVCDAFVDAIDTGGAGTIEIYTSAFGTLLAVLTFSATAFGAASNGVATADAITADASANATGTAAVARVKNGAGTTLFEMTVGTIGADINFNSVAFTSGSEVSISSFTITQPAS